MIYGRHSKPQSLELQGKQFSDLLHHSVSENLLVDLTVEGDERPKRLALLREVQHHPLHGRMLHVDFQEIVENEPVTIQVPVETIGEAAGVKLGGILEHVLFKLKLRGLPKDLPEQIELDVTHLEIGQAIHLGEVKPPPGVEVLGDAHIPVVAVAAPLTEAQEAEAEAAAAATTGEVEMIKEKKEEAGAEAAPAADKGAKAAEKAPKAAEKAPKAAEKAPEKAAEKKK